ncbi:hypothetical protein G7Y89_g4149 [Cudoniella acicularis]|uniref:Uncharacterized protein n=1 Tax=Cudoniella acicularis TaxID=354080 RepID=A0A8H4W5A3_9HELO|nr:hypothetical protein G7Y89_g4149 [Cudoniella acicularis]
MSNSGGSSSRNKIHKGKGPSKSGDARQSSSIQVRANILPRYFTLEKGYGIDQQARPWPGVTKTKADFAIRCVQNSQPKKVCLIKDKRVEHESKSSKWEEAVNQLTNYMTTARANNPNPDELMYSIVTVGHYSRFYELHANERELRDYSTHSGSPLHFKRNEPEIDVILCELVAKTQYSNSTEADYSTATAQQPPSWE